MTAPLERRGFLRGLVTLPLIGGGVTLIGAPSAPVPLAEAAAVPGIGDPRARARYAWEAFTSAMDEVAAGLDGWRIQAGSRLTAVPRLPAGPWAHLAGVRYAYEDRGFAHGPAVFEHGAELGLRL